MPDDRYQRWVDASCATSAVEPSMIPLVQGLGRFDCHLIQEDARFAALNQEQSSSVRERTLLTDRVTLSYFWVLAAYEFVRTLDQRWRIGATTLPDEFGSRVTELKRRMERLQIPLVKLETTRRFPTDSTLAYPIISRDFGRGMAHRARHVRHPARASRSAIEFPCRLEEASDVKKALTSWLQQARSSRGADRNYKSSVGVCR